MGKINLFELFAKIELNSSGYEKGIDKASSKSKDAAKTLDSVGQSAQTVENKIGVLSARYEKATSYVNSLTSAFNESVKKTGYASAETQELAQRLAEAEKNADNLKKEIDGMNPEIQETGESMEVASNNTSKFSEKLKSLVVSAAKATAAIAAAGAAAFGALTGAAVKNYAEYEQLVGGVETLFKGSADTVQKYAANAYETAGMSANEYMQNITSFSASLINSLGGDTAAAAEYANMAISDMSDNANKLGTDTQMVVDTYQSLARGNFAMLDNLKLGYGGTKAELERLLSDAEAYKAQMGETADYSINSFSDIVEAIHVVQNEMGITGTTALEASTTIEGSTNSMKASWENLLTGFADSEQNLNDLVNQFVESVITVGNNVVPRIIETVPRAIEGLGMLLSAAIPGFIELLSSAFQAVPTALDGLIANYITAMGPSLFDRASELIQNFINGFNASFPQILNKGVEIINTLVNGIISGIPGMLARLPAIIDGIITFFATNYQRIFSAGAQILGNLIKGIISMIPTLLAYAPQIIISFVGSLARNFPRMLAAGLSLVANLVSGIISGLGSVISAAASLVSGIIGKLGEAASQAVSAGANIARGLWNGIISLKDWVIKKVKGFATDILNGIKSIFKISSPSKETEEIGEYLDIGLVNGMVKKYSYMQDSIKKIGGNLLNTLKKSLQPDNEIYNVGVDFANKFFSGYEKRRKEAEEEFKKERKNSSKNVKEKAFEFSENLIDSAEKTFNELKEVNELTEKDAIDFWGQIVKITEEGTEERIKAEKKYYDSLDAFRKKHEEYVNSILNQMSLFSEFSSNEEVTGQDLISNLFGQVTALNRYSTVMEELRTKIGGTALFQELQKKGVNEVGELEALNSLSANRLGYYSQLYDTKLSVAESMSPYKSSVNNYNFTFNSPSALSESDARKESRRAYNDMILGY